jgi:hypothetical protein
MTMRIYLLLLTFFLQFPVCYAQQQNFVRNGVVTLTDTQMFGFSNMTIANNEASFVNIANNTRLTYPLTEISLIEDDNQKIIYKGETAKSKPQTVSEQPKDTLYRPNYPEGIYKTKEDFLAKKPSSREFLLPVGQTGNFLENIEHNCFFLVGEGDKLKNAFAVSYKGNLYFQVNAIIKNKNKKDKAQTYAVSHQFVRVIIGGENYFYTEADLTNAWAEGLAYAAGGSIMGPVMAKSVVYGKGIVWDIKNSEFNIFKNCKDYNIFITPLYSEGVQDCNEHLPNMYKVREAMEKIR